MSLANCYTVSTPNMEDILKRIRMMGAIVALGLVGTAGVALGVMKHTGSHVLDCNGAHVDYVSFANANGNTVSEQLLVNGSVVVNKTFVFNGSSGHDDVLFPTALNGNYTVQFKATWNTNGHSGSYLPPVQLLGCFTKTVTTTQTVTGPTQTVTGPTTTVQLPAPPAVTVTGPTVTLPAVTTTVSTSSIRPPVTVTVKSPPKVIYKVKKGKAPICKKKVVKVPLPKILKPTK